jgi:hypothetical protein
VILGAVDRRFGDEVAEVPEQLEAHGILGDRVGVVEKAAQPGVQILGPAAAQPQVPGLVVDAGTKVVHLIGRHAQVARQLGGRALDTVTGRRWRSAIRSNASR